MRTEKKEALVQECLIRNYKKYYRVAYSYVFQEQDAMDIVQEAACKAIYKSSSLKNSEYAGTWICRIVINEAYHVLRTKQKESCNLEKPEQVCEDIYQDLDLQRAIRQLNEKEQEVIYLRYYEEKQLQEIAEITKEKLSTVKSRLYRTVSKLKAVLADRKET